jgi:hypothetical protein
MLIENLDRLKQHNNENPISKGDYESWRSQPVTIRLLADCLHSLFLKTDSIGCTTDVDQLALGAVRFREACDIYESILDWMPEELIEDE